ncbi:MAG: alpha/beta fold hydrolase [Chitinivibrionales bacterium]|nr:alpha/beta fold hydrolase [Chitinivibrionales bacterium]
MHRIRSEGAPWIVFCHGFTAQRMGPDYLFVKLSRRLAAQGISSLRFDFAGCGESQGHFFDMTLSTMNEDLVSAIRFVRRRWGTHPTFLLGHSLGGSAAALCASRVKASGIALLAPLSRPYKTFMGRKKSVIKAGRNSRGLYEYGPHQLAMHFAEDMKCHDPLTALSGFSGDLIIFQGSADQSVSIGESGLYQHYAQRAGINSQYHIIPDNDHNFSTVAGVDFIASTLGQWITERV